MTIDCGNEHSGPLVLVNHAVCSECGTELTNFVTDADVGFVLPAVAYVECVRGSEAYCECGGRIMVATVSVVDIGYQSKAIIA